MRPAPNARASTAELANRMLAPPLPPEPPEPPLPDEPDEPEPDEPEAPMPPELLHTDEPDPSNQPVRTRFPGWPERHHQPQPTRQQPRRRPGSL